jgi:hypothetical protein
MAVWSVSLSTTKLISRGPTAALLSAGIRSLVGLGNLWGPQVHPVLYLQHSPRDASPKAISGRTSYLQVRLAYHPYPHLIRHFCNSERFGPPREVNLASPWTWVAHLVSCLIPATLALFRLAFALAAAVPALTCHRD